MTKMAMARSGWGSSNLTMKLADGRITEFGQQVDSGGAATLSSIASLETRTNELKEVKIP